MNIYSLQETALTFTFLLKPETLIPLVPKEEGHPFGQSLGEDFYSSGLAPSAHCVFQGIRGLVNHSY